MDEIEIPSYYLCPISYQIMKDPVTLSTGITYDRTNIERWIYSNRKQKCPITNQDLSDSNLTPNHTLRRLIQAWCVVNSSHGIERFPTPKTPIDESYIARIIEKSRFDPSSCVQKLKSIVLESDRNRHCVEHTFIALEFLFSILNSTISSSVHEEALIVLGHLCIPNSILLDIVSKNDILIDDLTNILQLSNNALRINAMNLLKSIFKVFPPSKLVEVKNRLLVEIMKALQDNICTKAALETLILILQCSRNRIKAVRNTRAMHVLIELLMEKMERRECEMILVILDKLSGSAEGRAEIVAHAAGISVISDKLLRVSLLGNERAVRILYSVARFSGTDDVLKEMMEVGAVVKLCMMLLVDCGVKAKEKAREMMRMHSRVWRNSNCLSKNLLIVYP